MATPQGLEGPLMARPGLGTKGSPVMIVTNAFAVNKRPDMLVHHYDVTITPEVPTRVKRQVFDWIDKHEKGFGGIAAVFDGQKNCYTPKKLLAPFENDAHSFQIMLPEDDTQGGASNKKQREGREFFAVFKKVAEVNLYELAGVLGGGRMTENCFQAITVLNVMIRHGPSILNISKGASMYPEPPPKGEYPISGGIELWRGYFSSIRPSPKKLIVNIDATAIPLILRGNLVNVASAKLRRQPQDLGNLVDRQRIELERFLKGVKIIILRNDPQTPRMHFKVKAISPQGANQLTFTDENGRKMTVQQYFKNVHNVTLRFPGHPCVKVTSRAWYPMEMCTVAPGNKFTKRLDPDQVAEALKFTTNAPEQRKGLIKTGLNLLGYAQNPICQAWGFSINPALLEIKARTLQPPTLIAKDNNGKAVDLRPSAGTFDMRSKKFHTAAPPVKVWGALVFETEQRFSNLQVADALEMMTDCCRELGLSLYTAGKKTPPPIVRRTPLDTDVRGAFVALRQQLGGQTPQLVVCFVTQKNPQYALIKQFGDISVGVATQCLQISKMYKINRAYFSNVALKMNVKLKGTNVMLSEANLPGFKQKPTIVFGADVTHPGPGSLAPSVAAVVGSFDMFASKYQAETSIQSSREEIIQDLAPMIRTLLIAYKNSTKLKPARIIFYRDGVSEGQYAHVYETEVKAIRKACEELERGYKPLITYTICAKRHHFRFFPKDAKDGDRSGNAKAGTVVDTEIVHSVDNDFFLQSHAGLLGTSRPTHYNCLLDDNKLGADGLQSLTYALCYVYARCNRSVSIVAPAYFAHHVATRARFHLGTAADDQFDPETHSDRDTAEINRIRDQRESSVRSLMKPIHANLKSTLYFL